MNPEFLPYLFLLLTIIVGWTSSRRTAVLLIAITTLTALAVQCITLAGVIWVLALGISAKLIADAKAGPRRFALAFFVPLSLALMGHHLPGFNNLRVFDQIRFSPDSLAFTMHLNFDKTIVAAVVLAFLLQRTKGDPTGAGWLIRAVGTLGLLVATILPAALLVHYVRFDPKFPPESWLWALNNLFFVCVAEEAFFRGFIQDRLAARLRANGAGRWLPVAAAALAFGACHYRGGMLYVALSTFAGLFYGFAYHSTRRLEAAVLVHFGLNAVHFFLFSYPALS